MASLSHGPLMLQFWFLQHATQVEVALVGDKSHQCGAADMVDCLSVRAFISL